MQSKTKTKVKLSAATIALASLIAIPFIGSKEGDKLESYKDVVGVWTICGGVTAGVKPGMKLTKAQCDELTHSTIGQFMAKVADKITVEVPPKTLAAHTSFAYNVGIGGYSGSKALLLTNAGDAKAGCRAFANWEGLTKKGIKYDCSKTINLKNVDGCQGLVNRRNDEIKLCLEEL